MAEWVIERGIGECRAALLAGGAIRAAMVERDSDGLRAGAVVDARLTDRRQALALTADGCELFVARWPSAPEGARVRLGIRRTAIREAGVSKRAVAVPVDPDTPLADGPDIAARAVTTGLRVRSVHVSDDVLDDAGWGALLDEAASGLVAFPGGVLRISLTPAMTVIDVDGEAGGRALAEAAVTAVALAIPRLGIGGNLVIDLPGLPDAAARKAVAAHFDSAMGTAMFERTAINGFGLLQVILPRERPSLLEQVQFARTETAALALLRLGERARGAGVLTLSAHPGVVGWLETHRHHLAELERRSGRPVTLRADASLAIWNGHAQ